MAQITLEIKDENVSTVLNILENLKDGLIDNIETNAIQKKRVRYQPNNNAIVNENQKPTGKYVSPTEYRRKIQ